MTTTPLPYNLSRVDDSYHAIRPVSIGVKEHDDQVATIILFQDTADQYDVANLNFKDYLDNLTDDISLLLADSMTSEVQGFPEIPGGKIPMLRLDKRNDYYGVFNNFSVTSMSELHDQITKVHMNFGAKWNVFLFGNTPNMYRVSGVFIDTMEYPYYQEFITAYELYLSGRKCVENGMQLKLIISGQIIDGFLLNVGVTHNSTTQTLKEFQFTMLVKGTSWIRTNYVQTTRDGVSSMEKQLNGMSNVGRLGWQRNIGLIDDRTADDTTGKVTDVFDQYPPDYGSYEGV